MRRTINIVFFIGILSILLLSLASCMPVGEPEKTEEEKLVKNFINDFIDEKYETIQKTYAFANGYQFDTQKHGATLNSYYEKYGEKSAISQVLKQKEGTAQSYYRELLLKKGKIWLNVVLNDAKQIMDFSITDAGAFEEKK